jgi:hypothetical protein
MNAVRNAMGIERSIKRNARTENRIVVKIRNKNAADTDFSFKLKSVFRGEAVYAVNWMCIERGHCREVTV